MNDDALRVMLAELCGWQRYHEKGDTTTFWEGYNPQGKFCLFGDVPNYPRSLDACHEAEKMLTDEQANSYMNAIHDPIDPMGDAGWKTDFLYLTATARQRTLALILTLQKQ